MLIRTALLLALVAPFAGCGAFECSFPDFETEEQRVSGLADVAPSDTLVVRVEVEGYLADVVSVYVPAGGVPLVPSETGEASVTALATVHDYEPVLRVRLDAEARDGVLVVTLTREAAEALAVLPPCTATDGLIRPVCSPAPTEVEVRVQRAAVPAGVRAVRVEYDDPYRGRRTASADRIVRG